ncbi:MAG: carboxylating nicotinate-nucleotide diphosphorylase [Thermoplasmatota archaeon]|nr:carboxylating nicotinate-nucleotide diphosphorylase [Candidatus Thermoplasmatota archaeon]MBU1914735.1 carboxylating nicotinate-nucleotide diphosphorylase [Candidatus Thermoplasmatota archaeon]
MKSKTHEFLREDIGSGDITSDLVIPSAETAKGRIICKEDCVLAGLAEASEIFEELGARVVKSRKDGVPAKRGDVVLEVKGPAKALLAGERLALNMIMRMSGIATLTDALVKKCRKSNPKVRVAATRKTTPGFREFEKRAVRLGGGDPHRMGLYDAVLIKNNHIAIAGGVAEALKRAKHGSFTKKIEIEVETEKDAYTALANGADIIMLDNFEPKNAKKLIKELKAKRPDVLIEVSGGIRPDNIDKYASAADIISLGWLTHSVKSVDFSMKIEKT